MEEAKEINEEKKMKPFEPKDQYTIVVYGDSISRGIIYDEEKQKHGLLLENFPNLVREHLKGVVHNAAKFGSTITEALQRFNNDIVRRKPDIVLIEFGGNDCDFNWKGIADDPNGTHFPNTDYNIFSETLQGLIEKLTSMNIIPVLVTLPPLDAEKYFRWVSNNSAQMQEKILQWMGSISRIYSWHERYNAAILDVAEKTKTRLIDIRTALLQSADYTALICKDGMHPNKEGHKIIAEKILNYITTNYDFLLNDKHAQITTSPSI